MKRNPSERTVDRRTALKQLSSVSVALTIGSGAVSASPKSNDGESGDMLADYEPPYPNVQTTTYDQSIYDVTAHPELLTLSDDAMAAHFETSSLSGRKFELARQYVTELRKRYPVERINDGNETIIQLTSTAEETLNNDRRRQRPILGSVRRRVSDSKRRITSQSQKDEAARTAALKVFSSEDSTSDSDSSSFEAEWKKDHHRSLAEVAAEDVNLESSGIKAVKLEYSADDPDEWAYELRDEIKKEWDPNVPVIDDQDAVDAVAQGVVYYAHNYAQYYDPDMLSIPIGFGHQFEFGSFGGAKRWGRNQFQLAKQASSDREKYTELGYALHFLQDCAVPLHTGMGFEQAGVEWQLASSDGPISVSTNPKRWLHSGFEKLVRDNWTDNPSFGGSNLEKYLNGSELPNMVFFNAGEALQIMAETSSDYSSTIYHEIMDMPKKNHTSSYEEWDSGTKENIYKGLGNCFDKLGVLTRGYLMNV